MSQIDQLAPQYQRPAEAVSAKTIGGRSLDWAMLVVALAVGSTLAWIYFVFRAVAYALQLA